MATIKHYREMRLGRGLGRCSPALGTPDVQRGHWGVTVDEKTYYLLFLFFVDECAPM